MKKQIIIIERDSLEEIEKVCQILDKNSIDFVYCPSVEERIVKETKGYFQSLLDKISWK
ncbi:MAG: hypothetical protein AM1032_000313 [Mycoplasmataceae bacterium]|nr:MAG: hypothetical protein AM1032_000313 [Mycoplasmataceae bacterium]